MTLNQPTQELQERQNLFKSDLIHLSSANIFRKHIVQGPSYILSEELHFELRNKICENFKVNFTDTLIVGSGKLGYSIAPHKRWTYFNDSSDIDIALVSSTLFDIFWNELYQYQESGLYWERRDEFYPYFFRGWIRPEKLPTQLTRSIQWWEFFNQLGSSKKYKSLKIRAGLYRTWHFLETYSCKCIEQCRF